MIAQWIAFFKDKIISNQFVSPAGDGSVRNALVTIIYLDEYCPLTAELFLLLSNLKEL
ncbi:MAG TPA: hypothetical protein VL201_02380 [Patescibacteria group bacterium]|nr:hypothetical protein [Patescibacteria group bacterium]